MTDERRYYGLDALRGGMMLLGIVLHAANLYLAAPPPVVPLPTDPNKSLAFDLVFHFIHAFRMPTFFVLAGFFAALLVEKRGIYGTWRDRSVRIVLPLVASVILILPVTVLLLADFALAARFGTHRLLPDPAELETLRAELAAAGFPADRPAAMHLWFLLYLTYFYLLLPLCRRLGSLLSRHAKPVLWFLGSPVSILILGALSAATLWPFHGGQVLEGFIFFEPHLPSLAYYGLFFVLGYLLRQCPGALQALARSTGRNAMFALVLFPLALWASHADHAANPTDGAVNHLVAVAANGLCTWSMVALAIGSAVRFFDRPSPWALYASQSAYWVYLVHLPLVAFAGWWLVQYDLPAVVKFAVVAGFTTVLSFLSYHYWVQGTRIGVFLHGRRFRLAWPWREAR